MLEQIRTLDKKRLKEKMGHLDDFSMQAVNSAIAVSFGLSETGNNNDEVAYAQQTLSNIEAIANGIG